MDTLGIPTVIRGLPSKWGERPIPASTGAEMGVSSDVTQATSGPLLD